MAAQFTESEYLRIGEHAEEMLQCDLSLQQDQLPLLREAIQLTEKGGRFCHPRSVRRYSGRRGRVSGLAGNTAESDRDHRYSELSAESDVREN